MERLLRILFLTCPLSLSAQVFELSIPAFANMSGSHSSFETHSNEWVSTYRFDNDGDDLIIQALLFLKEDSNAITSRIELLKNEQYRILDGTIVNEWSTPEIIVGFGTAVRLEDSLVTSVYWEFSNQNLYVEELMLPLGNLLTNNQRIAAHYNYNPVTDGIQLYHIKYNANVNRFIFYELSNQLYLTKDDSIEFSKVQIVTSINLNENYLYISTDHGNIIKIDNNTFEVLDTIWTGLSFFGADTMPEFVIRCPKFTKDDKIIASGYISIDRMPNDPYPEFDKEYRIALIDPSVGVVKDFYFGKIDTIVPNTTIVEHKNETTYSWSSSVNQIDEIISVATSNYDIDDFQHVFLEEPTSLEIFKFTEDLDLIWHVSYEDSAQSRLFNYAAEALSDGGALLYNYKYDYNNVDTQRIDLHILRIKPDGSVYTLDVPMPESPNAHFSVFPNPANDVLNITSQQKITALRISDIRGCLVSAHPAAQQIDVSGLKPGLYFIEAVSGRKSIGVQRFVKE